MITCIQFCTHAVEAGPSFNGIARTMVALRSVSTLCNVRVPCVRIFAPPHPLIPARTFWRQTAVRPGPHYRTALPPSGSGPSPIFPHHCLPQRSAVPHRWRPFRHLAAQAKSASQSSFPAAPVASESSPPPPPTTTTSKSKLAITNAEQRRRDWSIVRRLVVHIWPKDDWGTRGRVVLGVGLLICGKVRRSSSPQRIFVTHSPPFLFARLSLNMYLFFAAAECPGPSIFQRSYRHP